MDLGSCSVSSSMSSSAAEDQMVEMELEAAEALADLALIAMRETVPPEPTTNWGCKGKRVRKRVKTESPPPPHSGSNFDHRVHPISRCSDDQAVSDQQRDQTMCSNVIIKPVKVEQDAESLQPSPTCITGYTSTGAGRSRQNLTEAEKEARRMRRILANRESARQTIRRRQALCEELTKKAADLARENEMLKRQKELACKEYQSLENINKYLKARTAKAIKVERGEIPGELNSAHVEMSASCTDHPLLLYNHHPFSQLGWPSIIQSSHPVQSHYGQQNAVIVPSANGKLDSSQVQENHIDMNGTRTPLYIVPCPWFFPIHDKGNGCPAQSSLGLKNIQDETSIHIGYGASSSSKTIAHVENHPVLLPTKDRNEASCSTETRSIADLNDPPPGFPPHGSDPHTGPHSREATLTASPLCSARGMIIVKHENALQSDHTYNTGAISMKASHIVNTLPEKKHEPVNYPNKKLVDAVAAAEARKRRKELTKLKNNHGRQCRMHC